MHAMQGDGEIAGHTMDVSGTVTLRIDLLKGRTLEGPVLFPLIEDLPHLAKPLDETETKKARDLAKKWGIAKVEESAPISIVGSGPNLNSATEVGLRRAAQLLSMTVPEVMNRATITGGIEIGRHPGVVQITFLAPLAALESAGLMSFVQEQYGIG
jgi:formamidase